MQPETVIPIIEKYKTHRGGLIAILEDIQTKYGYLPEDVLRLVANETEHDLVDIYGVATFYKAFRLVPRGKHLISACLGTACHVRGGPAVAEEFEEQLGLKVGIRAAGASERELKRDRAAQLEDRLSIRIDWLVESAPRVDHVDRSHD